MTCTFKAWSIIQGSFVPYRGIPSVEGRGVGQQHLKRTLTWREREEMQRLCFRAWVSPVILPMVNTHTPSAISTLMSSPHSSENNPTNVNTCMVAFFIVQ